MEHVKLQDVEKRRNSRDCTVGEYITKHPEISIGVAEINGRYPDIGYAMNHKCAEIGYILRGAGTLVTESQTAHFREGDVLLVPQGEKFCWEGNFTVVLSATPAWYPDQHEHVTHSEKFEQCKID